MEIWISSEMDSDIAEEFRIANNELEDELKPFLASKQYLITHNSQPSSTICSALAESSQQ